MRVEAGRLAGRVAHECNWRKLICSTVRLERLFVRDEHAKPVCSSGETVRDEHANCCLSVKFVFFPSCRDIGEMR